MKLNEEALGIILTDKNGTTGIAVPKDKIKGSPRYDFKQITKAKALQRVKQYSGVITKEEAKDMPLNQLCNYLGIDYVNPISLILDYKKIGTAQRYDLA